MHGLDLSPLWPWLNGAFIILLSGLAVWLGSYLKGFLESHTKFLDKSTEALLSQSIDNALKAGVNFAVNFVETEEKKVPPIKTNSWIAATAGQYAIDHAPAAAAHFGLDVDALAEMAVARLPTITTTADTTGETVVTKTVTTS